MTVFEEAMLKSNIITKDQVKISPLDYSYENSFKILKDKLKTNDNLIFANITIQKDLNTWTGTVACTEIKEHEFYDKYDYEFIEMAHFRILEDGEFKKISDDDLSSVNSLKYGSGIYLQKLEFKLNNIYEKSAILESTYKRCLESIKTTAVLYNYSENNNPKDVKEISKTEIVLPNIHNLTDGKKYILENFPEYYMGCSIFTSVGDFSISPKPSPEYPNGTWETKENRIQYAKKQLQKLLDKENPNYMEDLMNELDL